MKKILLLVTIIGLAVFASCNGDSKKEEPSLRVAPLDPVRHEGGDTWLDIISNSDWTITVPDNSDWFTIEQYSGHGNKKVKISVEKNEGTSILSSKIIVETQGLRPREVMLNQLPETMPEIGNSDPLAAPSVGGAVTFNIVTLPYDFEWEILQPEASWITSISPMSGKGLTAVTVTFAASETGEARNAPIYVTSTVTDLVDKEIMLSQSKKLTIDDLVGTWEATGLYDFDSPRGPRTESMKYEVLFNKEDETTIVTRNFLNFKVLHGGENDYEIRLKFDPETQTINLPVQEIYATLDTPVEQGGTGWPTYIYPYRYEDRLEIWNDKSGFTVSLYGTSLDFRTDYEATALNGWKVPGSFILLAQDPADPEDVPASFYMFWGNTEMFKIY